MRKWLVLSVEGGIVCTIIYLMAQTFCDVNFVDIAPSPAVSRKACTFPLPKIPLPECPACDRWQQRMIEFFARPEK